MSEWKTYKLGNLINVQNGYAFKSEDFSDKGTPIIKIKNIVSPRISFDECEYFDGDLDSRMGQFLVKKGDILISMTGSHLNQIASAVGKVGKYQFDFPALLNQRVGRLLSKDKKVLNESFFYYFISRIETQIDLVTSAGGSGNQANISPSQIKNLELSLPDLPTQTAIAQILTSLDDKIELNLQMNQTLEAMAQALFKEWFVNFNFPGFDGELVDGLPKGWRKCQVKDICEVNASTLNSKDAINEVHYIEISEVDRGIIKNIGIYKRGEEPSRAKRKLKHGDTVLSTVRPNRGSYFLSIFPTENLIASTGFAVFSPTTVSFSYLYIFLTNDEQLEFYGKMADGAAYPAINQSVIMNMEIILPTKDLLEIYQDVSGNLLIRIFENLEANKTLTQTRDTLLPKLMSGKIKTQA